MECLATRLHDVKLIKPKIFADTRGFFFESWRQQIYDDLLNKGKPLVFTQDNHSKSSLHVLRGLHYQFEKPQGKLVRVISGKVYDVAVDLRTYSPTYGRWQGFYLSAENKNMLWVPPGFAHGFYALCDNCEVTYKCTGEYLPGDEHTIIWNDIDLAIGWPLLESSVPLLSEKDSQGVAYKDALKFEKIYA